MIQQTVSAAYQEFEPMVTPFVQQLVRIKSLSDQEGEVAALVRTKMEALGYDEVYIDTIGNVIGRIGNGPVKLLFDAHMDTVDVNDADEWIQPPFAANVVDGKLYGRGAIDDKACLASIVFAGALIRKLGYDAGKTIYIVGSVNEEFCDGEGLKAFLHESRLVPDYAVVCEPTKCNILIGHKGKFQSIIRTKGVSAHGADPEKGVNAVYTMAEIIRRVEARSKTLNEMTDSPFTRGSLALTKISSISASINAVPSECAIYLDRRTAEGETIQDIEQELCGLISGLDATWEIGLLHRTSWRGVPINYNPVHEAWRIAADSPLMKAANRAWELKFGHVPTEYEYSIGGTNAVTPVSMGVPTFVFGPGDSEIAHQKNEFLEVAQLKEAIEYYAILANCISNPE